MTEKDIEKIAEKVVEKLKTNQKNDYYKETEAMLRGNMNKKIIYEIEKTTEFLETIQERIEEDEIDDWEKEDLLEMLKSFNKELWIYV